MSLNAGKSTCPICHKTWLVTPYADCMLPACGCYGDDTSANNPNRPCESCGMAHAFSGCTGLTPRALDGADTPPLIEFLSNPEYSPAAEHLSRPRQ